MDAFTAASKLSIPFAPIASFKLIRDGPYSLLFFALLHMVEGLQDAEVFLLQGLESVVELFVPRVEDKHLESERRGRHDEVGQ